MLGSNLGDQLGMSISRVRREPLLGGDNCAYFSRRICFKPRENSL
ncbi:hypothetical protein SAMN06295926_10281 [Lysinibacillus sp. AC-3]|nr:hypothetical protein SAMN06295926_10281 [Lysinibacillus sp. AC-3]